MTAWCTYCKYYSEEKLKQKVKTTAVRGSTPYTISLKIYFPKNPHCRADKDTKRKCPKNQNFAYGRMKQLQKHPFRELWK